MVLQEDDDPVLGFLESADQSSEERLETAKQHINDVADRVASSPGSVFASEPGTDPVAASSSPETQKQQLEQLSKVPPPFRNPAADEFDAFQTKLRLLQSNTLQARQERRHQLILSDLAVSQQYPQDAWTLKLQASLTIVLHSAQESDHLRQCCLIWGCIPSESYRS